MKALLKPLPPLLALAALVLTSCVAVDPARRRFAAVDDFLLQLQFFDPEAAGETAYDLIVTDYSADGSESGTWPARRIAALRASGRGKVVLAYLSIGEAEDYRFYWQTAWNDQGFADPDRPAWLGRENPDWAGNFKVKYWDPDWQEIVMRYLDVIIGQGFDGVYMDVVDAYWYWAEEAAAAGETEQLAGTTAAADRMLDLIEAIAVHCRVTRGKTGFLLCPQNATDIINDASARRAARFLGLIDAVGAEDTFFFGPLEEDNPYNPQLRVIANLDRFRAEGKKVLATEYLSRDNVADIHAFYAECESRGYVPFATSRDLGSLRINAGHEPD